MLEVGHYVVEILSYVQSIHISQANVLLLILLLLHIFLVIYQTKAPHYSMQAIQVGAAKVLSKLLMMADNLQPYIASNVCFGLDDEQVWHFLFLFISLHPFVFPGCY